MQNYEEIYRSKYDDFQKGTQCLINLLLSIIKSAGIAVHAVTGRTKTIESFLEKAKKYSDPLAEIQDYIGLRIITYVNDDVELISKLIENEFDIDSKNSSNKKSQLGINKLGYISIHYIAKCKNNRTSLPEYSHLNSICFEIQVRTLLQHTWAEIEHDKNYKFSGVLPVEIKRRFYLLSGVLEVVDNEFNTIALEIDKYKKNVKSNISNNNLDIDLNTTSIIEYMENKYPGVSKNKTQDDSTWNKNWKYIIEELNEFGIKSIKDLDLEYQKTRLQYSTTDSEVRTIFGYLRDLMIINNPDRYFSKCINNHWQTVSSNSIERWIKYIPNIKNIVLAYHLKMVDKNMHEVN